MSKILTCLFIFYFTLLSNCQDECLITRINSFHIFKSYQDSVPYSIYNDISDDYHDCLHDTISLIKSLGLNVFYGKKNKKYEYISSYLPLSTNPYRLVYKKTIDPNLSVRNTVFGKIIPIELIKIYYIYALYENDFYFLTKIKAGYDNYNIGDGNTRLDYKLMNDAEESLFKWINLLEIKGLKYLRNEKISPLHFSKLKWE